MSSAILTAWGTVIAQLGATSGTPPQGDPAVIRYTVAADDPSLGLVLNNWMPERRIASGVRVLVAKHGDPCVIRVTPTGTVLWMLTEGIPFVEACPSP